MSDPCCRQVGGMRIMFAPPEYRIMAANRVIRFEFSEEFGPTVLGKKGDPLSQQPGQRHAFWEALEQWIAGGKIVGSDGLCAWAPKPDPLEGFVRIGNTRHWVRAPEPEKGTTP